jgi:hypothetical protein
MCYQRAQRLLMAIVLGIMLWLYATNFFIIAAVINVFVIVMLLMWAFLDFCPAITIFSKFLPSCDETKE